MKLILFVVLFLVTALRGAISDIQLTSSGPGTLRPGENLNLVCKVTGVSITDRNYGWNWIRQPPGKGLEWVANFYPYTGNKYYAPSLQSRATISADSSKNEFSLRLNSLTASDSAVYYCAQEALRGYFDYWGKGTMVTVTSASQSPPFLFPLIPSPDDTHSGDKVIVGCLAKDFLPDSLTLSWQKPDNSSLEASNTRQFPSFLNSNGVYTASSEATVPTNQWVEFEPFYCKAEHASQTRVVRVARQTPCLPPLPPKIIIGVPPLEDFQSAYLNATLLCKADNLHTEKTTIKWLKEGTVLTSGFTTSAPIRQSGNGYSITSELIVTKKDWYGGKVFSCQVQNEKYNEMKNVSKPSVCEGCEGSSVPVRVQTIPPTFADMFLTKTASLTCRTYNIPYGQDLSDLNVTWVREHSDGRKETLTSIMGQAQDQETGNLVFVDVKTNVCLEDWDSGDNFQCTVRFSQLASTEIRNLRKQNGGNPKAPSVYVLPPPSEQLALQETATLTCLANNFYPGDCLVQWLRNGEPVAVSEYHTGKPIQESRSPERYMVYSTLNIREQDWSYGAVYTCMVGHEALPLQITQKTVDRHTGKPTHVNVTLMLSDMASTCH